MKWLRWVLMIILIALIAGSVAYFLPYGKGTYQVQVSASESTKDVAAKIAKATNAYNADLLFASAATVSRDIIVPGNYTLTLPARYTQIWEQVYSRSKVIQAEAKKPSRLAITVTFPEGITADNMLSILTKNGYTRVSELAEYWRSYNKPLVQKYPFLPPNLYCNYGDISSCAKYYLEGYLYPDTYQFYVDENIESVTQKMLDTFVAKNPNTIKLDSQVLYKKMILASVVEEEAGRKGAKTNDAGLLMDRKIVAGIFGNRIQLDMQWQTDPSVTYGTGKILCQAARDITDCAALDDRAFATSQYNTYIVAGAPIGPISNPSSGSIEAALNPTDSSYLFFVSDLNGKMYYATTNADHNINIANLQSINDAILRAK
jgi:UPF0755 protein